MRILLSFQLWLLPLFWEKRRRERFLGLEVLLPSWCFGFLSVRINLKLQSHMQWRLEKRIFTLRMPLSSIFSVIRIMLERRKKTVTRHLLLQFWKSVASNVEKNAIILYPLHCCCTVASNLLERVVVYISIYYVISIYGNDNTLWMYRCVITLTHSSYTNVPK